MRRSVVAGSAGEVASERPVVVVGAGLTGRSCARHLRRLGHDFVLMDSRAQPPGLDAAADELAGVPLHLGELDAGLLSEASMVVLSPGIPRQHPALAQALQRGVPVIGDIELFARAVAARAAQAKVLAITGSNGKSTVTCMLRDMLRTAGAEVLAGGNLGPPALALLEAPPAEFYVLELSSFQLASTEALRARAVALLNISEDHLDHHGGMQGYRAAKLRILRHAPLAVLPPELMGEGRAHGVPELRSFAALPRADRGPDYGLQTHRGEAWLATPRGPLLAISELAVPGLHNVSNALAAAALAHAAGVEDGAIAAALRAYHGLDHRCELVARAGDVRWINDSKGTNVGATVAAIEGLAGDGPLILIAGGQGKGADFAPLAAAVRGRVRQVLLLGEDAPAIEAALAGVCPVQHVADMADAVRCAAELAGAGDTVLLSPACASFDLYDDYQARGRHFRACVSEVLHA